MYAISYSTHYTFQASIGCAPNCRHAAALTKMEGIEDSATAAAFRAIDARDEVGMLQALMHGANFVDVLQYAIDSNFEMGVDIILEVRLHLPVHTFTQFTHRRLLKSVDCSWS